MSATRQGMSSTKINQIVTKRDTDAIEAIAVYETKISMAYELMNQVVRQGTITARNANNKSKWGSDHGRNSSQQQNKIREVVRAHTVGPGNKKGSPIAVTNQRAPMANQKTVVICYECGRQGHYKSECLNLKNQNCCNEKGNEGKAHEDPNVTNDNADA
ncbi:reverse transcriptase domain-containing protein [Tanacetum coccineum]